MEKEILIEILVENDLNNLKKLSKSSKLFRFAQEYMDTYDSDYVKNYCIKDLVNNILYPYSYPFVPFSVKNLYEITYQIRDIKEELKRKILIVEKSKELINLIEEYEKKVNRFNTNTLIKYKVISKYNLTGR